MPPLKDLAMFASPLKGFGDHSIDHNDTLPSLPNDLSDFGAPFSSTPTTNEKQPTKPVLPLSPELSAPPKSGFGPETKRLHRNSAAKALMFKHRQAKYHVEPSKPSVCIDLDSYTPKTPPHNAKRWLNNDLFQLDQSEKAILLTPTAWLTDSIIDASQKLLLQKMPSNTGFQSITLGRTLYFEVQSNEFVQILHNGHGHWLTISTVGMTHPEVCVYDSMYPTTSTHVKHQIASLLATTQNTIRLRHMDVQMQSGGYDCGLFAIAFATALVHGEQPGRFLFDQDKMRHHLLKCLQEGELTPFPVKKTRRNACRVKSWDTIEVHCVCRMPEVSGVEMIECSNCKTWYHIPFCISVPIGATQARREWFCPKCT